MKVTKIIKIDKRFSKMTKNLEKAKWKWFNLYLIRWINLWIHWWFSQKIQIIKMGDIFRKFVNILNESVEKFNWICGWIQMNSLMNFNDFVDDSIEFIDELSWFHRWIFMNWLRNSSELIEES